MSSPRGGGHHPPPPPPPPLSPGGDYLFSLGKIDPRREYSSDGTREICPSPQRDNFPSQCNKARSL
eukprot:scaffold26115_cov175-Skeletonema_marinoi.AAC.1